MCNSLEFFSPVTPSARVTPVDLSHLRRYTLGDKDLEWEILGLFLAELPRRISALDKAETIKDWNRAAHSLKGSGQAVGAWHIAELAEKAEFGGLPQADTEDGSKTIAALQEAAAAAKSFIEATYGQTITQAS